MEFRVRDLRQKQFFMVDDIYLNGYAKLCGWKSTLVYMTLCRHAGKEQTCFPSQEMMAKKLAISKKSVLRAIRILEEWGIIKVTQQGRQESGLFKNNTYMLLDKKHWKKIPKTANGVTVRPTVRGDCESLNGVTVGANKVTHIKETHIERKPSPAAQGYLRDILDRYQELKGYSLLTNEPRLRGEGKKLKNIAGSLEAALECMEWVANKLTGSNLNWKLNTVIEWYPEWLKQKDKDEVVFEND